MKAPVVFVQAALLFINLWSPLATARTKKPSFQYEIQISDPYNAFMGKQSELKANVKGAIEQWNSELVMRGTLRVLVQPTDDPSVSLEAASVSNTFIGYHNGIPVYEEGAAHLIRTGINLDCSQPDLIITINAEYFRSEVWIDPMPLARLAAVPMDKVDLVSLLTHELGHAFGFLGFIDATTGLTNPNYLSVFDQFIKKDAAGNVYFTGANAKAEYGSRVPLTPGNYYHYGTSRTPALFTSLMNGLVIYYGTRYSVGALDLAIMRDLGQTLR